MLGFPPPISIYEKFAQPLAPFLFASAPIAASKKWYAARSDDWARSASRIRRWGPPRFQFTNNALNIWHHFYSRRRRSRHRRNGTPRVPMIGRGPRRESGAGAPPDFNLRTMRSTSGIISTRVGADRGIEEMVRRAFR